MKIIERSLKKVDDKYRINLSKSAIDVLKLDASRKVDVTIYPDRIVIAKANEKQK